MYYTDIEAGGRSFYSCSGVDQKDVLASMPADSDTELPPNPALEDHTEHGSSHQHTDPQIDVHTLSDGGGVHGGSIRGGGGHGASIRGGGVRGGSVPDYGTHGSDSRDTVDVHGNGDKMKSFSRHSGIPPRLPSASDYSYYPRSMSRTNIERPMEYEYSNEPDQELTDDVSLLPNSNLDYVNDLILQRSRNRRPGFAADVNYSSQLPSPDSGGSADKEELADGSNLADSAQNIEGIARTVNVSYEWTHQLDLNKLVLGQVTGVATDSNGHLHLFHRASRQWTSTTFDLSHRFLAASDGPITENTVIELDGETGRVILQWGSNMFYLPHGLHIDAASGNIWLTDVALHQVMRFKRPGDNVVPDLVIGVKFEPGNDEHHFCKPTSVAVLKTGQFYVADGYCNSRVIQFTSDGKFVRQWGERSQSILDDGFAPVSTFSVVHSVVAIDNQNLICVADRENSRIQCFDLEGHFVRQIHTPQITGRVFAVTYCSATGYLYAINGPDAYGRSSDICGYTINPATGSVIDVWKPNDATFKQPHDLAVSVDGYFVFVSETGPNTVWKLISSNSKTLTTPTAGPKAATAVTSLSNVINSQPLKQTLSSVYPTSDARQDRFISAGDFGPSLFIGSLLFVPVTLIVCITVIIRLRRSGRLRRLFQRNHVRRSVIERVRTKDIDRDELEHLQPNNLHSDSDVDEYNATHQRA
jgi:peptidylamidoglycolate lyase